MTSESRFHIKSRPVPNLHFRARVSIVAIEYIRYTHMNVIVLISTEDMLFIGGYAEDGFALRCVQGVRQCRSGSRVGHVATEGSWRMPHASQR